MIKHPIDARFADKNLIMVVYGLPGVGKTTLALSAPSPFIFDVDQGLIRVKREHLKDYDDTLAYKEILKTLSSLDPRVYKTVIIDTVGALIETQKGWAAESDPKTALKTSGGFALGGYGIIKSEYIRLAYELKAKFNVILVFHAIKEKNGDEIYYDLVCEGAAKVFSWQPADLGAYMYIERGKRYLGFSPTGMYSAKSGHGIKGIVEVPEVEPGQTNDFLTRMFEVIRQNIKADDEASGAERERYAHIVAEGRRIIAKVKGLDDIATMGLEIKALGEALTSKTELGAIMKARFAELGIAWNREKRVYEQTQPQPTTEGDESLL